MQDKTFESQNTGAQNIKTLIFKNQKVMEEHDRMTLYRMCFECMH